VSGQLLHKLNEFPTVELPELYSNQDFFNSAIRAVRRPNEQPTLQARSTVFPEESVRKYISHSKKYKLEDSQNFERERSTRAMSSLVQKKTRSQCVSTCDKPPVHSHLALR
jgi:hypothetical protein